ncbi:MAG: restriction endonuclease [Turicibacter sp.]
MRLMVGEKLGLYFVMVFLLTGVVFEVIYSRSEILNWFMTLSTMDYLLIIFGFICIGIAVTESCKYRKTKEMMYGNLYELNEDHEAFIERQLNRQREIKRQYLNSILSLEKCFEMNSRQFELCVRDMMSESGYLHAQCTKESRDGGKDIIAYDKLGNMIYVEVKQFAPTNSVGRPVIQKFHSAMVDSGVVTGMVITTSYFTEDAKAYAKRQKIELIDGQQLVEWMEQIKTNRLSVDDLHESPQII